MIRRYPGIIAGVSINPFWLEWYYRPCSLWLSDDELEFTINFDVKFLMGVSAGEEEE